jgi:hypothetical protein
MFAMGSPGVIDSIAKVDMVRCKLDNKLYVRKSVEKGVVARNPSVCCVQACMICFLTPT